MIRVDSRESAHLKSRVKDLSVVPNMVSYNGLFACITPISKLKKNEESGTYEPILIRDVESLIANFGDPRVDPDKYIDLYCIMQLVANGGTCYVAKVDSGDTGEYEFAFVEDPVINTGAVSDDVDTLTDEESVFHDLTDEAEYQTYTINSPKLRNLYLISGVRGRSIDNPGSAGAKAHGTSSTMTVEAKDAGTSLNGKHVSVSISSATSYKVAVEGFGGVEYTATTEIDGTFKTIDPASPVTFTPTSKLVEDNVLLNGGANAVPPTYHEPVDINPEDYTYNFVGTDEYSFTLVYTGPHFDQIQIMSAELDPNYGREDITLGGSGTVYSTGVLARKYSFIEITAGNLGPVIEHTGYSVHWEAVTGGYKATFTFATVPSAAPVVTKAARQFKSLYAYSSVSEDLNIYTRFVQLKPLSLKLYYLYVDIYDSSDNHLASGKVKLEETTTNQMIVNVLNSALKDYLSFELVDISTASAAEANNLRDLSIAYTLLNKYAPYSTGERVNLPGPDFSVSLDSPVTTSVPNFTVTFDDYVNAINQYKDHKYNGRLLADLTSRVTPEDTEPEYLEDPHKLKDLDDDKRRSLHYKLKEVACERKDCTVILSTPNSTDIDDVCAWVSSQGNHTDLWEYGETHTDDPALQSFYLEIYYSWLNMSCTKLVDNKVSSVTVEVAPSSVVINNILTSWRNKGMWIPVAGDQGGVLPDSCTPIVNPATKLQRDQLVQYRINPIWDTGTRGVQIFGNETLNAGYTDLNAAHIARTLVYIRSTIDEYTETLKFSINSLVLWEKWKTYVASKILEPLVSANALAEYQIEMGENTTSAAEIANRRINGLVHLRFYQSAEIFNLTYTVYSTSTTIDEARSSM